MTTQFNQEKYNKLLKDIRFNINHSDIFMSNEYFNIIQELNQFKGLKSTHMGFVYSYMYLQSYMCRNVVYDYFIPTTKEIKEILGYSPIQKSLDYIIKKGGLLDNEKLTITDNDFPLICQYNKEDDSLLFDLASDVHPSLKDYRHMHKVGIATTYKFPVLSFYDSHKRDDIELFYGDDGGTFYDVTNTTNIRFEIFAYCMSHNEIGDTGFYLYSYIKHKNDLHGDDYKATYSTISNNTGLAKRTVHRYMEILRSYNLIETEHNMDYFSLGIEQEFRKASTHIINPFEEFDIDKNTYKKLPVKTRFEHFNIAKKEKHEIDVNFDL